MSYGIIYSVTNIQNRKVYIGQTIQPLESRIKKHLNSVNAGSCSKFHSAIRKHGIQNFKWRILGECNSMEELNEAEITCIEFFDCYKNGYNSTIGGDGTSGFYLTNEHKQKVSKNNKRAMTGKSFYECWVKNYGVEEATRRKELHKERTGAWRKEHFKGSGAPSYRHDVTDEMIFELRKEGLSTKEICQKLNCTKGLLVGRLSKYK